MTDQSAFKKFELQLKALLQTNIELDKSKDKPAPHEQYRVFRELVDAKGFNSDIKECDQSPRLYYEAVVLPSEISTQYATKLDSNPSVKSSRFRFLKEQLVLLRTYKEIY